MGQDHPRIIVLVVHKQHIKTVKNALEARKSLDRRIKVRPLSEDLDEDLYQSEHFLITTTVHAGGPDDSDRERLKAQLVALSLEHPVQVIEREMIYPEATSRPESHNALRKAVDGWLQELPRELLQTLNTTANQLLHAFPTTYSIYEPMLLLPAHSFQSTPWQRLLQSLDHSLLQDLYSRLARRLRVTHIAINAPIPQLHPSGTTAPSATSNDIRSPSNLVPLYGDFGPPVTDRAATPRDFATAFWVSTRQNGITQCWAPLHTMFSRGNIREKTRLLTLPSVLEAVDQGRRDGRRCAAVDMYVGVGYFAFSYVRAGLDVVLGWEINGWSVEGLRRGAVRNGWGVRVLKGGWEAGEEEKEVLADREARLLVWERSNEFAGETVERLRDRLPPIRHVNCGLLPSSMDGWKIAVRVLDPIMGGWLHLHMNLGAKEIEERSQEMLNQINNLLVEERKATLEHVEKVKTFAPGVVHCVLDVYISPRRPQ